MGRLEKQKLFQQIEAPTELAARRDEALKACALCGGHRVRRLYMQAHFPVVRCRGCGLVYADEHFKASDLESFYSGDYYQRAYVCHPAEIDGKIARDYCRAFARVQARQPEGGRLLDFGSARGTFLEELTRREQAPNWELTGLDINPDEVRMGTERGLDIVCADLESAGLPEGGYAAITAFSVLEHLQDPVDQVTRLARLLQPGGRLLAIVPAGGCLIIRLALLASRLFGDRVRSFTDNVFHEEHLYYFTPRTARLLLERSGLELETVFYQPSYLETHPPGALVALGAYGLRAASWCLRMETMLAFVARRPE